MDLRKHCLPKSSVGAGAIRAIGAARSEHAKDRDVLRLTKDAVDMLQMVSEATVVAALNPKP